jgi:hypothetical protein
MWVRVGKASTSSTPSSSATAASIRGYSAGLAIPRDQLGWVPQAPGRRDAGEDLRVEVEAEVVAGGDVGQPVVTDPDHAPVDLIDHRVDHLPSIGASVTAEMILTQSSASSATDGRGRRRALQPERLHRQPGLDRGTLAGDRAHLQRAADQAGPLPHAGQAEVALAQQPAGDAGGTAVATTAM